MKNKNMKGKTIRNLITKDRETVLLDEELLAVAGGYTDKPADCGDLVDQYKIFEGNTYYYYYTGGGHKQWMPILIIKVYEKNKFLWFTERFATVQYESGLTGDLPLDTDAVYYKLG